MSEDKKQLFMFYRIYFFADSLQHNFTTANFPIFLTCTKKSINKKFQLQFLSPCSVFYCIKRKLLSFSLQLKKNVITFNFFTFHLDKLRYFFQVTITNFESLLMKYFKKCENKLQLRKDTANQLNPAYYETFSNF